MKFIANIFWNEHERRIRALWRLVLQIVLLFLFLLVLKYVILLLTGLIGLATQHVTLEQMHYNKVTELFLNFSEDHYDVPLLAQEFVSTFASVWLAGRIFDRRRFANFGFRLNKNWWIDFGFGLFLGGFLISLVFLVELAFGWVTITGTFVTNVPNNAFVIAVLYPAATMLMVGIQEELTFRGYQLTNLAEGLNWKRLGPRGAVIGAVLLSAVIFALLHAGNPNASIVSTFSAFMGGIIAALGFILTGELAISIGLHITWNFFQANVFGFTLSGMEFSWATLFATEQRGPTLWVGDAFGPESGLLAMGAVVLGCLLIWLWVRLRYGRVELRASIATVNMEETFAIRKSHRIFIFALIIILSIIWLGSSGCTTPPPTATEIPEVEEQTTGEPTSPFTDTPLFPTPIAIPPTATPTPMVLLVSDEPMAWEGDYIGQEPPGSTPELFASDFFSTDGGEFAGTFSPDGKEFFFTKEEGSAGAYRLWFTRMEEGGWTEPGRAPFACDCFEYESFMTPDGRFLLYGSQRPYKGADTEHIWVVERTNGGWGEPQLFDAPLNDDFAMYVTISNFGNVYYTGPDGIYVMELLEGKYSPPEKFSPTLNFPEESYPAHPFIAPDESYLIFDAIGDIGYGDRDLYASFRNEDGSWSEAVNLGDEINTERYEMIASVSPDGKFLFFTRDNRIYWVDAAVIRAVKPTAATTTLPILTGSGGLAVGAELDGDREIYLVNADGSGLRQLTNNTARDGWASWSPDGEQLVFMSDRTGRWLLYTMNADGSNQQMLTTSPEADYEPAWSPDGKLIVYSSQRGSDSEIYVMTIDSGEKRALTNNDVYDAWPAWSPDSSQIAFISPRDGDDDIYIVDVDGGNQHRLIQNNAVEAGPNWSPDGKNIVFTSDLDGDQEIYVVNVDGSNLRQLTDNDADDWWPVWSPDGERIAFISDREGEHAIYWMNPDGSAPVRLAIDFPVGIIAQTLPWLLSRMETEA